MFKSNECKLTDVGFAFAAACKPNRRGEARSYILNSGKTWRDVIAVDSARLFASRRSDGSFWCLRWDSNSSRDADRAPEAMRRAWPIGEPAVWAAPCPHQGGGKVHSHPGSVSRLAVRRPNCATVRHGALRLDRSTGTLACSREPGATFMVGVYRSGSRPF